MSRDAKNLVLIVVSFLLFLLLMAYTFVQILPKPVRDAPEQKIEIYDKRNDYTEN